MVQIIVSSNIPITHISFIMGWIESSFTCFIMVTILLTQGWSLETPPSESDSQNQLVQIFTIRNNVKFHTLGGGASGQNWVIFTLFFIFFLSCPKSCKSAKKKFFSMGGGTPLPESPKILDMLGKNLEIFLSFMDL